MKCISSVLSATALFLAVSCGDSLGDLGNLVGNYVHNFSNQWEVVKGKPTGLFFFNVSNVDSTKGTGNLDINENTPGETFLLKGTFDNLKVSIHYLTGDERKAIDGIDTNGPLAGTAYKGLLDTLRKPVILRMVNTADGTDSLVLKQGF